MLEPISSVQYLINSVVTFTLCPTWNIRASMVRVREQGKPESAYGGGGGGRDMTMSQELIGA